MEKKTSNKWTICIPLLLLTFILGTIFQKKLDIWGGFRTFFASSDTIRRQKLRDIFSIQHTPSWSETKILKKTDYPTYQEQLLQFIDKKNKIQLKAYLLKPKGTNQNLPGILCLHGHHSTKENVAGISPSRFNINYGHTLAKNNYIVLIPEIRYSQDIWREEDPMGMHLLLYGKSLTGERLKDLLRCVSYLKKVDQVDPDRIGVVGWSMGGGLALYLSAIDQRINCSYISCYFGTYEGTIIPVRQSTDNYIPGIKNFGELYDIAALIAPRPLLIEHGKPDREFPVEIAKMAFEHLKNAYSKQGAVNKTKMVIREGGHRFYGDQLLPWFNQYFYQ